MNKKQIIKELSSNYYYLPCINITGDDLYMCSCGYMGTISPERITYKISDEMSIFDMKGDSHALDGFLQGKRILNIRCEKCSKDLSSDDVTLRLQNLNTNFFERFYVTEKDNYIQINRISAGVNYDINEKNKSYNIIDSYIRVNKQTGKIFIKQFEDEKHKHITIDKLFDSTILFFEKRSEVTYSDGYINLHDWIGKLSKIIRDIKNMNIVDELLNLMIGKSGFDIIAKIAVVFLSIISYSNLSTISLTKGNIFLFDLLANCKIPDEKYLKKTKATSPLKIFNSLVKLQNEKIQKRLDESDTSKMEYVHTDSKSLLINKIKQEQFDVKKESEQIKKNRGKVFIKEIINDKTITPFWFSKLNKYSDYERSLNWLRIVNKEEFLDLLNKHDLNFLINAYKVIEFRDDLNLDRIKQFLDLMTDHCLTLNQLENTNQLDNYNSILSYDFNLYDDCYRMIEELKWDANKVLFKIKTQKKLFELHENLLKHRSYINNAELNGRFIEFSEKFKYLENYSEDLKIGLKINLIQTPEELMNHAVDMHNCAGSYVRKVANGQYISFIVFDNSKERTQEEFYKYMMVLEITPLGLEFVGIKSRFNKYGSNRFKENVKKYLIDKDINFKNVPSIQQDVQSNEFAYQGFFEKIIKD